MNDNYRAVAGVLGVEDLVTLARNSIMGSFLPQADIARHLAAIDAYVSTCRSGRIAQPAKPGGLTVETGAARR